MLLQLQFAGCTAPGHGIDVGDRLRESPPTTREVFDGVLALAVRMVGRRSHDLGAVLDRTRAMPVDILNPHHRSVRYRIAGPQSVPLERQRRRLRSSAPGGSR